MEIKTEGEIWGESHGAEQSGEKGPMWLLDFVSFLLFWILKLVAWDLLNFYKN